MKSQRATLSVFIFACYMVTQTLSMFPNFNIDGKFDPTAVLGSTPLAYCSTLSNASVSLLKAYFNSHGLAETLLSTPRASDRPLAAENTSASKDNSQNPSKNNQFQETLLVSINGTFTSLASIHEFYQPIAGGFEGYAGLLIIAGLVLFSRPGGMRRLKQIFAGRLARGSIDASVMLINEQIKTRFRLNGTGFFLYKRYIPINASGRNV